MAVIYIWDIEQHQLVYTLTGHKPAYFDGGAAGIEALAFNPDGYLLASAGYDGTVRLWNAETGELLRVLDDPEGSVEDVAFNPDGTMLAAGVYDGTILLWRITSP